MALLGDLTAAFYNLLYTTLENIDDAQSAASEDSLSSTSNGTDDLMLALVDFTLTRCRSFELFACKTKECFEQQDVMTRWMRGRARSLPDIY